MTNSKDFIIPQSSLLDKKRLFVETLINNTDKVSKISENSVLSGIASGISRISGLIEKDVTIYFSKLHPDYTSGEDLDTLSKLYGIPSRLGPSKSSTYILLIGEQGTTYSPTEHFFLSESGVVFELSEEVEINENGFQYVLVRSQSSGSITNVSPYSINKLNTEPTGHISVFNEVGSVGGRDVEQDELFRRRIKEGVNLLALNTLSSLEQRCISINSNVLKIVHQGLTDNGKVLIKVLTQNGVLLNSTELQQLSEETSKHLTLTDHRSFNKNTYSIEFQNIDFFPVDIELRLSIDGTEDYDSIRIKLQTQIIKYLDWRNWDSLTQIIEWDNLLEICKSIQGVRYIQDQFFKPNKDIIVPINMYPRLRSFRMIDLSGRIISSSNIESPPVFYQNSVNISYQSAIL